MLEQQFLTVRSPDWEGGTDIVHVWLAELNQFASYHAELAQWLSRDEQLRAQAYYQERARGQFIVTRGILRNLLGRYLQCSPGEIQFVYNPHGKPALTPQQNHKGLHFNLSHSENLALFAFSQGREIGIDIEYRRPLAEVDRIVRRVFSEGEQIVFRHLPACQKFQSFYRAWTSKEAYLKATGKGLAHPLRHITVSLLLDEPARLISMEGEADESRCWLLQAFYPASGYTAALVVEG